MEEHFMKSNSELRNLANLAKQRMKMGKYNNPPTEQKQGGHRSKASSYFICNARALRKVGKKAEFVVINQNEDKELVSKVYSILSEPEIVYNPIGRLVDKKLFSTMSEYEKELYILTLADKFNKIKDDYYSTNVEIVHSA